MKEIHICMSNHVINVKRRRENKIQYCWKRNKQMKKIVHLSVSINGIDVLARTIIQFFHDKFYCCTFTGFCFKENNLSIASPENYYDILNFLSIQINKSFF